MNNLDKIKKLRELTSLGVLECKKALQESKGDFDTALGLLKKRGIEITEKKKGRKTAQGLIDSYIHFGGNLGVLVEVNCETDFVAKTDVFKSFVRDLAIHIAACSPEYISKDDIPEEKLRNISDIKEYTKEHCLMEQLFVKDNSKTVGDCLREVISKTGENIVIKRFARFSLEDAL